MAQPTLFDPPPIPEPVTRRADFERFHAAHPEVLALLVRLALDKRGAGFARYSIKALWEVARFTLDLPGEGGVKLNNNLTAHYARKIMAVRPDLAGFFHTRERRAA